MSRHNREQDRVASGMTELSASDPAASGQLLPGDQTRGWYMVGLLCLLLVFSFIDRLILGLLAVDVGRDLGVNDTQIGLLIGTTFAVAYVFAGLPIAHLLDTRRRKPLLCAGVLLWSSATILSAFAENFALLATCRAAVAIGEAALTPAAISLIADSFPGRRRILPTTVYSAVPALMGVGAFVLGAAAFQLAQGMSSGGSLAPWRLTLVLVGIPPLLIGLIFAATVREPARGRFDEGTPTQDGKPAREAFLPYLRHHAGFFGNFYAGNAVVAMLLFGIMTWTPTLLIRGHGFSAATAGYATGAIGISMGAIGSVFWPQLAHRLGRRGRRHALPLGMAIGMIIGAPFIILGFSASSIPVMLGALTVMLFIGPAVATLTPLTVQHYAPPHLRARFMSLVMFSQSLIGYGVGPAAIAWLSARWSGDRLALGYSLSLVALMTLPVAALCFLAARRRARFAEMEAF